MICGKIVHINLYSKSWSENFMKKNTINAPQPEKEIRAFYTEDFIRVYQAYSDNIADSALDNKSFVSPPFSMSRMTWIKPSFLWMMYRSGWGKKDYNQSRILAIDLSHQGFKEILSQGILSKHQHHETEQNTEWKRKIKESDVVIQWDPERDIFLNKLNYRTIQIGLRNQAVIDYCQKWIVNISDLTKDVRHIYKLIKSDNVSEAIGLLPKERVYDVTL